jgi:phosphoribosylaminoimidazolecarboxamide formyltransferase / IMP cyclohydrolase
MTEAAPAPRRALLSVSDKTGLAALGVRLAAQGFELISTGGSAATLREAGLKVTDVADYTGFPELLDGRVKTLHPRIHAGLLARLDRADDRAALAAHGIGPIEVVAVNLYPFERTVAGEHTLADAIENIDIGGPTLLRAAAKNCAHVAVLTDPAQYDAAAGEIETAGAVSAATRFQLAVAAFNHVSNYDAAISDYLSSLHADGTRAEFPGQSNGRFVKVMDLRYGENPHQRAAFYRDLYPAPGTLATLRQHQGKELSYNNLADADAAWECVRSFDAPACVIVKHANPCGVALGDAPAQAYERAYACDPTSAFGGIIAFNRPLDAEAAQAIVGRQFAEVILAPAVAPEALAVTAAKANIRVLEIPPGDGRNTHDVKRVGSGLLIQTADTHRLRRDDVKVVTRRAPTDAQLDDLLFAWTAAQYVKSNAIVFARDRRTLGIGAGQMSRVDSTRLAALKAGEAGFDLTGSVLASDAFFPFRDGLDQAAKAGACAVIQPGGSMRDAEVIAAADEHGIAMVFTGVRHFRH